MKINYGLLPNNWKAQHALTFRYAFELYFCKARYTMVLFCSEVTCTSGGHISIEDDQGLSTTYLEDGFFHYMNKV